MATAAERGERAESMPAGLQMAGSMGELTMPDFRVSWAFVLEETPRGATHLIERFRVRTGEAGLPQRMAMPVMGCGVFVMTRKQMLGIESRAEGAWRRESANASARVEGASGEDAPSIPEPSAAAGSARAEIRSEAGAPPLRGS